MALPFEDIGTLGGGQRVSSLYAIREALQVKLVSYHPVCSLYNFQCNTTSDEEFAIMWTAMTAGNLCEKDFIQFVPLNGEIFYVT